MKQLKDNNQPRKLGACYSHLYTSSKKLTGRGTGCSLCRTCTMYLLVLLAGQLYKTSILFPPKGATVLPLHFLD